MRKSSESRRAGFTLIELLVVISIIGILISLILVAAADGVRRAEERQTQTLITKLETALTDRVDALLQASAPINQTHRYLAAITYLDNANSAYAPIRNSYNRRAQVIAQFDFMKAELPDVFYRNSDSNYPLNFAAVPYPLSNPNGALDFALPLGNRWVGLPFIPEIPPTPIPPNYYNNPTSFDPLSHPDTGIYGASFTAAAGLYKNLYEAAALDLQQAEGSSFNINTRAGYDAADNGGVLGLTDDIGEVTVTPAPANTFASYVSARLAKHDHKTARSEMLYALLVEGQGPLGSAYNREDFTSRDVADTDGDGMPEFIDAWGQPLQFYRWPIYNGGGSQTAIAGTSGSQMGFQPYNAYPNTPRQLDPLDPNQLLVSVGWWTQSYNGIPTNAALPSINPSSAIPTGFSAGVYANSPASPQANAFMTYFHILIDPLAVINPLPTVLPYWDRNLDSTGAICRRRAYYSKFLVLSGGPDKEIGVFRLGKDYQQDIDSSYSPAVAFPTLNAVTDARLVNWCENQAAPVEFTGRNGPFYEQVNAVVGTPTSVYLQNNAGSDDISNQTLTSPGSGSKQ